MPPSILAGFVPVGAHQSTTLGASVVTLSLDARATGVLIQTLSQSCRYTLDGSNPTTSFGFVMVADADPVMIPYNADMTIKILRLANGAVLQYQGVLDG